MLDVRREDEGQSDAGAQRYRAHFISDIRVGTKACQAQAFLDFLKTHKAPRIYLVGDIVDFWRIRRGVYWPQTHNDVLQKLLREVRKGTELIYIRGNHDEAMREYCGSQFGGVAIERQTVHTGADGQCYLIMHGNEFDFLVRYSKWLAFLGDWGYVAALWFNTHLRTAGRCFGKPYWSLSAYLKYKVKRAGNFIGEFEHALAQEARRTGAQCVICGDIHLAAMRQIEDVVYIDTGDWVGSCTAVVETEEGDFQIIRWNPHTGVRKPETSSEELEAAA
ncbi:MAG: UDP-2,3-diacylglucosamine diphosphatase [Methyloceanibacter sp.]|jgi:UDP-2,3-diacylglucosamine pyrophosphatase LpxH|uniref:UDP-2,3-diacylglucosamine diphosphatase n=1 Tax=Methyloceanibacter sp. TaxID=1965321 RepID=UPI003C44F323